LLFADSSLGIKTMNKSYRINKHDFLYLLAAVAIPFVLSSCSSATTGETFELLPADEMKSGPGLFSGEKGGFVIIGKKDDESTTNSTTVAATRSTKSISNMDLQETSKVLDERIKQLERDQVELERLKSEVDKKLKN